MPETPLILGNNVASKATITGQEGSDLRYRLLRMVDFKRYTRWHSNDTIAKDLVFNVPSVYQRPVNCLIIDKNHTLNGVQCRFAYSDDGVNYTQIDVFTPSGSGVIFRQYTGQTTHQYHRLNMAASSELNRINQIWFGQAWSLERNPAVPFDPDAENITFDDYVSQSGIIVRYQRFQKRVIEMKFPIIQAAMYTNIKTLFSDFKTYGGFLWFVFRPTSNPADILFMINKTNKRSFPYPGGIPRTGSFQFEEVL